jgi:hypothetical protein
LIALASMEESLSYYLDRGVVLAWIITIPLLIAGQSAITIWITFVAVLLLAFDIVVHLHFQWWAWAGFVVFAAISGAVLVHVNSVARQREVQTTIEQGHGWLIAASHTNVIGPCERYPNINPGFSVFVDFGPGLQFAVTEQPKLPILVINDEPVLTLLRDERGRVAVNAVFFDTDGKVIATIEKNEFRTNQKKIFYAKGDASTLEVVDDFNHVILHVHVVNDKVVYITGTFRGRSGKSIVSILPRDDGITTKLVTSSVSGNYKGSCMLGHIAGLVVEGP